MLAVVSHHVLSVTSPRAGHVFWALAWFRENLQEDGFQQVASERRKKTRVSATQTDTHQHSHAHTGSF